MAYVKNTWIDQEVERPKTYEMTNNSDGSITLVDSFGLVTELGTPVNAANMNHIEDGIAEHEDRITVLEESTDTSNFVQKSGDTMTGTLVYQHSSPSAGNNAIANVTGLAIRDTNISIADTTIPTAERRIGSIQFQDKNSQYFGEIRCYKNINDQHAIALNVNREVDGAVKTSYVRCYVGADGTAKATCPTPDLTSNTVDIATTAFVKNVLSGNGYGLASFSKSVHGHMTLANGIIFQWGLRSTSSHSYTLTFPKAFPTACRSIMITGANDTDNNTTAFKLSSVSATGATIYSAATGFGFYWFAIGY